MLTHTFGCQVCLTTFNKVLDFKKHVSSWKHRKNMNTVFPKEKRFEVIGSLPHIIFLDSTSTFKYPIIGLSQLTVCYTPGKPMCFYLCHLCEEKCPPDRIKSHFFNRDHNCSYFSYTNPDSLNFAWIPSATITSSLKFRIRREVAENGPGVLQILDLPEEVFMRALQGTYSEVMQFFDEHENLSRKIAAVMPKRKTILLYLRSDTRRHPLLGMQHIVECICAGQKWKRHYLCTLCHLTLTTKTIVKHVLSFDHIYSYFTAWHPSTLMSRQCYKDNSDSFSSLMLDLAHQSQNILGSANSDMKQMILQPDVFTSVTAACYDKALTELGSVTKDKTEHSLITSIKPGNKLEPSCPKLHRSVIGSMDTIAAPKSTSTDTPNEAKHGESQQQQKEESVSTVDESDQPFYVLRCQDCNMIFEEESLYCNHALKMKHQKMVKKIFKENAMDGPALICKQTPGIFTYVRDNIKKKLPVVGASLIVTVLCTKVPGVPFYICFACEDCFLETFLSRHMVSSKHVIKTLMYQNPWRLPFAWDKWTNEKQLQTMAWEEEKERGRSERMLKVLDVPHVILRKLIPRRYPSVMDTLVLYHGVLKRCVPPCETYRKLDQNDRFPLLGMQFLVKYGVNTGGYQRGGWCFMCLLCQRKLPKNEQNTHIFSRQHVTKFLESFHPGSLSSHHENKEILLDLAKQAARIHPMSSEQKILLEQRIREPCPYKRLQKILASAKKRNENVSIPLEPSVAIKMKLVPRVKIKEVPKNHVKDDVTEDMNQKCPENSQAASGLPPLVESVDGESDKKAEVALETCLLVKETSAEELTKLTAVNQSGDTSEREKVTQCTGTEIVPNQRKDPRKRTISQCKDSKDTSLIECVGEGIAHKKQRLIPNEETEGMLDDATAAEKGEQLKQYFSGEEDCLAAGLNVLYECWCEDRDPIYLCENCSQIVTKEDIIHHVTDSSHQKMHRLAVDLDEDVYSSLLNENFITAQRLVRAHLDRQEGGSELPSTSGVHPVATSVTTACQHEVNCSTDNIEVVDMEIDVSEEPFHSVTAAIPVMTNASAFSEVGPDCLVELGVQMAVTQDITVNKMDATPSSCFSATSSSIAKNFSTTETVRSDLVTSSCTPTNMKSNETAFKSPAATSCAAGDPITSTTVLTDTADTFTSAPSKPMGKVSHSNTTKPSTSQLDAKAEAGPKVTSATYKSASISVAESADVYEDPFKTTPSCRDLSETASNTMMISHHVVVSSAPPFKSQPQNTEARDEMVYVKNAVSTNNIIAPNVGKSDPSAVLTTPVSARSQHKTPPTEPSLIQNREMEPCPIGINQLIKVTCERRRQTYCKLCRVRLMHSSHTYSPQHQYNYVKLKNPGWTANKSEYEEKLHKTVVKLAEDEKDAGSASFEWIPVPLDVYQKLAALPDASAVQRLEEMLKQKNSRNSLSTTDPRKNTRQPDVLASPSEFASEDFEVCLPPYEIAGLSTDNQTEKRNTHELKTGLVQKAKLRVESPSTTLDPLTTNGVSVRPLIRTPDTSEETSVHRQQQNNDPVLQDAQVSTNETPSSTSISSDALVRPSTFSQKAQHAPRYNLEQPEAQETIRMGEKYPGPSNLSKSLSVLVTKPFIGLGSIWECRGIANKPLQTIYLCECCQVKLFNSKIAEHVISTQHQINYMRGHPKYNKFMYWIDEDLKKHQKEELVRDIVSELRWRETLMDAQSVLLHSAAYKYVESKPFIKALNLVRTIQRKDKVNLPIRPAAHLSSQNA